MPRESRAVQRVLTSVVVVLTALSAVGLQALPAHASGVVSVCDESHLLAALAGGGSVTFSCSGTILLSSTITISSGVTIDGSGANVTLSGNSVVRPLTITGGTVVVMHLTLSDGSGGAQGGAVDVASGADVTLDRVTVASSTATTGGGIFNAGTLLLKDGTVSGNTAPNGGGGIFNDGAMTITRSTVSGNFSTSGSGGGINNWSSGTMTINNSTISGNGASYYGGITNSHALAVNNSTVASNTLGGATVGIHTESPSSAPLSATTTLTGTIVANNGSGPGGVNECTGESAISGGYNVIRNTDTDVPSWTACHSASFTGDATNLLGTTASPIDPQLRPLADNGGPTQTMPPGNQSPAVDRIPSANATCVAIDQRGVARPIGGGCDIGAVERDTLVVDSTGDQVDSSAGDGACRASGPTCTLRAAIQEANATTLPPGAHLNIWFDIPGAGAQTIAPATALPAITQTVHIDGTTQPGSACPSGPGVAATLNVVLDGAALSSSANGLSIDAQDSEVRGLVVINVGPGGGGFSGGNGIAITQTNATIRCNLIGVGPDGATAHGNGVGVYVRAAGAQIGGATDADRDVISGNGTGVLFQFSSVTSGAIQGNYVGTNAYGTGAVGNTNGGVVTSNTSGVLIGGPTSSHGNLISGNPNAAVSIGSSSTTVRNNLIGTDLTGDASAAGLGNVVGVMVDDANSNVAGTVIDGNVIAKSTTIGIWVSGGGGGGSGDGVTITGNRVGVGADGAALGSGGDGILIGTPGFAESDVTVGGTGAGQGNVVANNHGDGISVGAGAHNALRANSIYDNGTGAGDLGIDLGADGVTANDAAPDNDAGANDLQNFPVLTAAVNSGGATDVTIALDSSASTDFAIDVFDSGSCDTSGNGEGASYLGTVNQQSDGAGHISVAFNSSPAVPVGHVLTATATATSGPTAGDTSEFSACATVSSGPTTTADLQVSQTHAPATPYAGQDVTYTVTVTNAGPDASSRIDLTDTIPTNSTLISATVTGGDTIGTCTTNVRPFTCDLAPLAATATATITVAVSSSTTFPQTATNLVTVANHDGSLGDPSGNDTSSHDVVLADASPTFGGARYYNLDGTGAFAAAFANFDGANEKDIAVSSGTTSGKVSVFLNDGSGGFSAASPASINAGGTPTFLVSGDFNGGAGTDLVVNTEDCSASTNATCGTLTFIPGHGDGTFGTPTTINAGNHPQALATADVDGDGNLDVVAADALGEAFTTYLGKGDGTFTAVKTDGTDGQYGIAVADLDQDGNLDVVTTKAGALTVYLGNGDGTFQAGTTTTFTSSFATPLPKLADFDTDGVPDVLVTGDLQVFLNDWTGALTAATTQPSVSDAIGAVVGDFAGNGQADIETARRISSETAAPFTDATLLKGDGEAGFVVGPDLVSRYAANGLAAGQLDGQNGGDLVVLHGADGKISVLLNRPATPVTGVALTQPSSAPAGHTDLDAGTFDFTGTDIFSGALEGAAGPLDTGASTKGTIGASTKGTIGASTKGTIGASTKGTIGASTKGTIGASTKGAIGASTKGTIGASTKGTIAASTKGTMPVGAGASGEAKPTGSAAPLANAPLRSLIDHDVPNPPALTQIGVDYPGGWPAILAASSALTGTPVQRVNFNQVHQDAATWAVIRDLPVSDFDFSGTPIGDAAQAAQLLGQLPLSDLPLTGGYQWDGAATDASDDHHVLAYMAETCYTQPSLTDLSVTLLDLSIDRCDLEGSVPWNNLLIRNMTNVTPTTAPLATYGFTGIDVNVLRYPGLNGGPSRSLGDILVSDLPSGIVDCTASGVDCSGGSTQTLGQVQQLEFQCTTATPDDNAACARFMPGADFGQLLSAPNHDALIGDMRLRDFMLGSVYFSNFPFWNFAVDQLVQASGGTLGPAQPYSAAFTVTCPSPATTVKVVLPNTFSFVSIPTYLNDTTSATITVGAGAPTALGAPAIGAASGALTWTLAAGQVCASSDAPSRQVSIDFKVDPAPGTGVYTTILKVITGTDISITSGQIRVTQALANQTSSPSTAPTIPGGHLLMGQPNADGSPDYYRIPLTQADEGTLIRVILGSPIGDNDLVMYGATASSLTPNTLSSNVTASPVGDQEGCLPPGFVSEDQSLDNVPLVGDPTWALRGFSTAKENPLEVVCTVVEPEDLQGSHPYLLVQVTHSSGPTETAPYVLWFTQADYQSGGDCVSPVLTNPNGPGQTYDATSPYTNTVSAGASAPSGTDTVFLINEHRFGDIYGLDAEQRVLSALDSFASRSDVNGVIVPVESSPAVASAYDGLNNAPCSIPRMNDVVTAINSAVRDITGTTAPQNVVIVGGDDVVPFARVRDMTSLGNQTAYASSVTSEVNGQQQDNPISRSFARSQILTDDPYGTFGAPFPWLGNYVYIPDVALGRLVETPDQIVAQLAHFESTDGKLDPKTALVTGADKSNPTARGIANDLYDRASHLNDEVQRVTVNGATSGNFALQFGSTTTGNIKFDATPDTVQADLEALTTIDIGNVLVTTANNGGYKVEFTGTLGDTDVATLLALNVNLNAGATIDVSTVRQGNPNPHYGVQTLLTEGGQSGSGPTWPTTANWTREEMICRLNGLSGDGTAPCPRGGTDFTPPGLISVNGHFNNFATLPGDANTGNLLTTVDVAGDRNEMQDVTVASAPSGGTFTLSFGSATTGPIAANASAADVATALTGLSTIGADNVLVTGNDGGPWTVEFAGELGNAGQAALVSSDLNVVVTTIREGATYGHLDTRTGTDLPSGALLFTIGCNSGVSIPDAYITGTSRVLDWAEALASRQGTLVGNQGFGYGEGTRLAFSERLMRFFSSNLDGSMTIGQALTDAKGNYWSQLASYTPYDAKAVQESVMYGLPMYQITGGAELGQNKPVPLEPDPDPDTGLQFSLLDIGDPSNQQNPTYFVDPNDPRGPLSGSTPLGNNFFVGNTGLTQVVPNQPIEPQSKSFLMTHTKQGLRLSGALITELDVQDFPNFDPVVAQLSLDGFTTGGEPYLASGVFPTGISNVPAPVQGEDHLVLNGGRFVPTSLTTGTQTIYTHIQAKALYQPNDGSLDTTSPTINASSQYDASSGIVSFQITTSSSDVVAAYMMWRPAAGPKASEFQFVTLSKIPGTNTFTGSADTKGNGVAATFGQAVDASGNVAIDTFKGTQISTPTVLTFSSVRTSVILGSGTALVNGYYTGPITFRINQTFASSISASVDGVPYSTFGSTLDVPVPGTTGGHFVTYNASGQTGSAFFNMDSDRPTVQFTVGTPQFPGSPRYVSPSTPITVTIGDVISGVATCSLTVTGPNSYSQATTCVTGDNSATLGSTDGVYTVRVQLTDRAGNMQDTAQQFQVTRDGTPPSATLTVGNPQYNGSQMPLYVDNDPATPISVDIVETGSGIASCTITATGPNGYSATYPNCHTGSNAVVVGPYDGVYTFETVAADHVENSVDTLQSLYVTRDGTAPTISHIVGAKKYPSTGDGMGTTATWVTSTTPISYTVFDPAAGSVRGSLLKDCTTTITGPKTATSDGSVTSPGCGAISPDPNPTAQQDQYLSGADGKYTIHTVAHDNIGNESAKDVVLVLDNTAPRVNWSILDGPPASYPSTSFQTNTTTWVRSDTRLNVNVTDPAAGTEPGSGVKTCTTTVTTTGSLEPQPGGMPVPNRDPNSPNCVSGDNTLRLRKDATTQDPDGTYTLKTTASDNLDNANDGTAQTNSTGPLNVTVDNTPPAFGYCPTVDAGTSATIAAALNATSSGKTVTSFVATETASPPHSTFAITVTGRSQTLVGGVYPAVTETMVVTSRVATATTNQYTYTVQRNADGAGIRSFKAGALISWVVPARYDLLGVPIGGTGDTPPSYSSSTGIGAGDTTFWVQGERFGMPQAPFLAMVGNEQMLVTSTFLLTPRDTTTKEDYWRLDVVRGYNGTTATGHGKDQRILWSGPAAGMLQANLAASTPLVTTINVTLPGPPTVQPPVAPFDLTIGTGYDITVSPVSSTKPSFERMTVITWQKVADNSFTYTVLRGVGGTKRVARRANDVLWMSASSTVYLNGPVAALSIPVTDNVWAGVAGSGISTAGYTAAAPFEAPTTGPAWNGSELRFTLDPTVVGMYALTMSAVDNLGNTSLELSSATSPNGLPTVSRCLYEVIYKMSGFYAPVQNDVLNVTNAGQSVALKWKLTDYAGAPILDSSTFVEATSSVQKSCDTTPEYAVYEEQFKGGSALQNLGGGNYQFNWATPKTSYYSGHCFTLSLRLAQNSPPTYTGETPGLADPMQTSTSVLVPSRRYEFANFQFKAK